MAGEERTEEESENRSIPLSAQGNQGKMFNRLALSLLPINLNCCGAQKGERKETEGRRAARAVRLHIYLLSLLHLLLQLRLVYFAGGHTLI